MTKSFSAQMDKATILSDAVRYVKEQQEKLKALQDRDARIIDSVVLVKRPCISNVDDGRPSPPPSAVAQTSPTPAIKTSLPEIDARILEQLHSFGPPAHRPAHFRAFTRRFLDPGGDQGPSHAPR